MKHFSVKIKITIWLTLLMLLLAVLLSAFMLSISSVVSSQTAMRQLEQTVKENLTKIQFDQSQLLFSEDFSFSQNGVSILIYSQSGALLAGQPPVSFTAAEDFQNGLTRRVEAGGEHYLLLDLYRSSGWEDGIWVRGLMPAPNNRQLGQNLLLVCAAALPAFLILVMLGSYLIVKRAFAPLDSISSTAAAINEAKDLSRRIGLPPGKDEFSRLALTFDQLFERLERSFEAEKQFTADASHELRTPVSIIKGACEYALKYDETPEDRQETISMIHRQSVKMTELISQLLKITRLDQGTEQVQLQTVALKELLSSACLERGYDPTRLTLTLPEDITLQADPALLTRLVQNLIDNAFKYGSSNTHVCLSVSRGEGEILLRVEDNGIGIARENQDKVWQRFYQVDPSRSGESGAGLGLSMVQQIARAHGGYMTLESELGKGSAFTLHLPDKNIL